MPSLTNPIQPTKHQPKETGYLTQVKPTPTPSQPSVNEIAEPSVLEYEALDACLYSPNALFRCAQPGQAVPGASIDAHHSGGLQRCEESFTQPTFPGYDIQVQLSGEYNHRLASAGDLHTLLHPQVPGGHWSRSPFPHEAAEHVTPLGDRTPGT